MVSPLIGAHAFTGEIAILAFLWVFVELIKPDDGRIKRAKIAALIGTIMIFASWLIGGFYYVNIYGSEIKPEIKAGPNPWAHSVVMETKEHVFLFLPFLSILTLAMIYTYGNILIKDKNSKIAVLLLAGIIVLIGLSMVGMGYMISSEGYRAALEVKV